MSNRSLEAKSNIFPGLETTFNTVAEQYDRMRPTYVEELYDDIWRYGGFDGDISAVEVGIGTGQATQPVLNRGASVTELSREMLIDMMQMQKKRTVFIEYYDCTAAGVSAPELDAIRKAYSDVPDYAEKPAWYIAERMPCSLIKGVTDGSEERLCEMVMTSIEAYARLCRTAPVDPNNLKKLVEFRSRMLTAGNPSSATMEKVLGPDGAKAFFENVVMPMN